jgi:hypothetical protein
VASVLASMGPPVHDAVVRRVHDPATRHAMCAGIASAEADADARRALMDVPPSDRDDEACVDTVGRAAAVDDAVLGWLGRQAEPGLLGAASRERSLGCVKLHAMWSDALATRPPTIYPALAVPLGHAVTRCAREMDPLLADTVRHKPDARALVVRAIDPFAFYEGSLEATCAALRGTGRLSDAVASDRLADALSHTCRQ